MRALNAREAYRLWAPTYSAETPVSLLDEELARHMLAGLPCRHLLDAGCGTGRRLAGIAGAVGVDACPEMIAVRGTPNLLVADIRQLPFAADSFDMVWCRLVLGHLPSPAAAYSELGRVCQPGGYMFVSDFHPDAVAAGSRRSFRDHTGHVHAVEHYVHANHVALAAVAGFSLVAMRDGRVGPPIREFYADADRLDLYEKQRGLRLVSAFLFRKAAACA